MTAVLIICGISCAGMLSLAFAKPKVKIKKLNISTYWIAVLLGAVILLLSGLIKFDEVVKGLTSDDAINPIKILVLFLSMTVLSIFLDETGFFKYLANFVLKKGGSKQIKLFTLFYIAVSIITIFTSNDIIILTFTPFICYFAKNAKINPIPYLVSEFVAANTFGMFLIIGNPTNIYLATANGIDFVDYVKIMAIPTLFAATAAYLVMLPLFYKYLKTPVIIQTETVKIEQKSLLITGLIFLSTSTILLAISSFINLDMWLIALVSALSLVAVVSLLSAIKHKKPRELGRTLKRTPWELIPFVVSMFILVLSLEKYGITKLIAGALEKVNVIFGYGAASVIFSNLINNIPMSVLFSSVVQNLSADVISKGIYSVIIGSNIGAFLTPIGALAGMMWLQILKYQNVDFGFLKFLKYGIIIAVPTLTAALLGLTLSSMWI